MRRRLPRLSVFLGLAILAVTFQNCRGGSGGSSLGTAGSGTDTGSSLGTSNSPYKNAPPPVDISLNTISYMSCPGLPAASSLSQSSQVGGGPGLTAPFYTLRVGAYDNSRIGGSSQHIGGIFVTREALGFLGGRLSGAQLSQSLSEYVRSSPFTSNRRAVVAVVAKSRSRDWLSGLRLAAPLSDSFSLGAVTERIANQPDQGGGRGPAAANFFPQLASDNRGLTATIIDGGNESQASRLRAELMSNHFVHAGIAPNSSTGSALSILQNLSSPDNDPTRRLLGRSYGLTFEPESANFRRPYLSGVTEYSLNPSTRPSGPVIPIDLTSVENQNWSCFNLDIVRDIDRKIWLSPEGRVLHRNPARRPAVAGAVKEVILQSHMERVRLETLMINEYITLMEPLAGTHRACPEMNMQIVDSNNPIQFNEAAAIRYRVARRFLPADKWIVNTTDEFRCAVPRPEETIGRGQSCYASGDDKPALFIQYPKVDGTDDPALSACGPGKSECSAFASFCYRTQ